MINDGPILAINVDLDLVRRNCAIAKKLSRLIDLCDREIRYADHPGHAGVERLSELLHVGRHRIFVPWRRPVQKKQIDLIDAKLVKACLNARSQLTRTAILGRDLGRDKDLIPGYA